MTITNWRHTEYNNYRFEFEHNKVDDVKSYKVSEDFE